MVDLSPSQIERKFLRKTILRMNSPKKTCKPVSKNFSRCRIAQILFLILLIIIAVYGVVWFLSSPDEPPILQFSPKLQQGSLIRINISDKNSIEAAVKKTEEFLKPYELFKRESYKGCDFGHPPPQGRFCDIDLEEFEPCTKENSFGYERGTPCVFIKLSRERGWFPEFHNVHMLPELMPLDLKADIERLFSEDRRNSQTIWLSCEGRDVYSSDDMGPISYFIDRGFAGFHYPCMSDQHCTEPLVAVYFKRPRTRTTINVRCKIWAKNIQETIDFEVRIE